MTTPYDAAYFTYLNVGARRSAEVVVPLVVGALELASVVDVGCGQGVWLAVWETHGVTDVVGVDGDYVDRAVFRASRARLVARDLSRPFDLGRRFDLVQSLEVGEHLPASSAAGFVASLVRHGDLVLFSAAPKGQGGDHHVNEQGYEYWRALFARHGFVAIDWVRPLVRYARHVDPWYRYNIVLYASARRLSTLPPVIRGARVPDATRLSDVSPPLYRLRKALVRPLPVTVVTGLARLKERWVTRARRVRVPASRPGAGAR